MIYYLYIAIICIILGMNIKKAGKEPYSINNNLPIRGLLAIMVVMSHMFEEGYLLGNIAVSIFFCFSGYRLIYGYFNNKEPFKNYFRKKIVNTLIPFWMSNILYCIYYISTGKNYSVMEIVLSFFNASILTIGWYIIVLFIIYVLFFIIYKHTKFSNIKKFYLMCIAIIILIVILYLIGCGSWWYCSLLAFLLGMYLGYDNNKLVIIREKRTTTALILAFILVYIITKYYNMTDGIMFLIIKIYMSIMSVFLYIIFANKYAINSKLLNIIGKNSLIIYLLHPLVMRVIKSFYMPDILRMLVVMCISLGFSYIYNKGYDFNVRGNFS